MLGCHDFCGYYDWTFGYVRSRFGDEALMGLWAEAIGRDSQRHYEEAGRREGLAGLAKAWNQTGIDEHCEWSLTLDEKNNFLRWDMRQCPSKGFLLSNDCNADEDYCDHCMGWIIPLLARIGMEVTGHEHNHVGQCWAEISVRGKGREFPDLKIDIRNEPGWTCGYLHRWRNNHRLPLLDDFCASSDPCVLLGAWFSRTDHLLVMGRGAGTAKLKAHDVPADAALVTGAAYAMRDTFVSDPLGVLLSDRVDDLAKVAERFHATPTERRPLLMYTYLPSSQPIDFVSAGLPRPVPILPQLIRQGYYAHKPGQCCPTTDVFLAMLAISLQKRVHVLEIEVCQQADGKVFADDAQSTRDVTRPVRHSRQCDLSHLREAIAKASAPVHLAEHLQQLIEEP